MNSTHATVGVGATAAMAALTTLLTGFHGLDADHAAAASWLVCNAGGAIYAAITAFCAWKWPAAPHPPGPGA